MPVAGSVIIGMREEEVKKEVVTGSGEAPLLGVEGAPEEFRDSDDETRSRHELDSVRRRSSSSERSDEDGTLR